MTGTDSQRSGSCRVCTSLRLRVYGRVGCRSGRFVQTVRFTVRRRSGRRYGRSVRRSVRSARVRSGTNTANQQYKYKSGVARLYGHNTSGIYKRRQYKYNTNTARTSARPVRVWYGYKLTLSGTTSDDGTGLVWDVLGLEYGLTKPWTTGSVRVTDKLRYDVRGYGTGTVRLRYGFGLRSVRVWSWLRSVGQIKYNTIGKYNANTANTIQYNTIRTIQRGWMGLG